MRHRFTLGLACLLACTQPAFAQAPPSEAQLATLLPDYRAQQVQRLVSAGDRDSLIAAALLGLPEGEADTPVAGHDAALRQLYSAHGDDLLSLYAIALACQELRTPCPVPEAYAALMRVAPGNAVHWLVQPRGARVDRARLHAAAETATADSHHSQLLGIVRAALAGQPAPAAPDDATAKALGLAIHLRVAAALPYPAYGAAMATCSAQAAAQASLAANRADGEALRTDCANLGHALFSDQGQQVVTRMYGATLLRRFAPNTHLAGEALAFRRQYLWLDQLRIGTNAAARDRLEAEAVAQGEWEALQRQAERSGSTREPPPDWQPKDPSALLLPELRGL
jgi:hypothetical protein